MFGRVWHISQVVILVSVVLFVLGFLAAMDWAGISNPMAWTTAGLAVFAASFLPWKAA